MNYVALLLIGIVIGAAAMYIKPPGVVTGSAPRWIMMPVSAQTGNIAAWKLNTSSGETYLCLLGSTAKASCIQAPDTATP